MKKLIIANWKDLPETVAEAEGIMEKIDEYLASLDGEANLDLVICPPERFMNEVAGRLHEGTLAEVAVLGAQDMPPGHADARYVIIGHSDRRWKLGESDEVVNRKLKTALAEHLIPIVCLGERTRAGAWQDELEAQIVATFAGVPAERIGDCLVAYEPVWAISTNPDAKPDTPASAVQSLAFIRETLADRFNISIPTFLYGGSVTQSNAADFLTRSEIRGVLVGGASVRAEEFCEILGIAQKNG